MAVAPLSRPGQNPGRRDPVTTKDLSGGEDDDPSDSSATEIDVVQVAADRIRIAIGERFANHRLRTWSRPY